jgi:hypothetical protein
MAKLARDEHIDRHPALHQRMVGDGTRSPLTQHEAETLLRASGDPKDKQAVAEMDAAVAAKRERVAAENQACAAKLGLTMDGVRDLTAKLAADVHLWSWLQSRVNWTQCHNRPLSHDE